MGTGTHESPYPLSAMQVRLDHLEGRMKSVEHETEPVPVLIERVTTLTAEVLSLRQSVVWLTRAVLGASGVGAVAVGALVKTMFQGG